MNTIKLSENNKKLLDSVCWFYGLTYQTTGAGLLVSSGVENWIIKLKKDKVRRLYHQNYRANRQSKLDELDSGNLHQFFHLQEEFQKNDLKSALQYIYNHRKTREKIERNYQKKIRLAFC